MVLIETDRLILREFSLDDAEFVLKLVNEPSWVENIGDKNIHNLKDAESYIQNGPLQSYHQNGYGLYMAELKLKSVPVGICGLVKREFFTEPDVGFAFLPEFWGVGFASESAKAVLEFAKNDLNLERVLGITNLKNTGSMRVLEKIGLKYDKMVDLPGYEEQSRLFIPK